LYDCALCGLYKASRSERGGCWCNERSKVNLLEWRSLRNQVRRELLEEECGGRAIYRTRRAGI
jgi:hypothetical protein